MATFKKVKKRSIRNRKKDTEDNDSDVQDTTRCVKKG